MRYSASEKYEIIRLLELSSLSVKQTLARLDINRSTFYAWLKRYEAGGLMHLKTANRLLGRPGTSCLRTSRWLS